MFKFPRSCNRIKGDKKNDLRKLRLISDTRKKTNRLANEDFWIISEGRNTDVDLCGIEEVPDEGTLKEYEISEIARYLLNPGSIEIKKRLIGCEIHYRKRRLIRIKEAIGKIFPRRLRRLINSKNLPPDVLISSCQLKIILCEESFWSSLYLYSQSWQWPSPRKQ